MPVDAIQRIGVVEDARYQVAEEVMVVAATILGIAQKHGRLLNIGMLRVNPDDALNAVAVALDERPDRDFTDFPRAQFELDFLLGKDDDGDNGGDEGGDGAGSVMGFHCWIRLFDVEDVFLADLVHSESFVLGAGLAGTQFNRAANLLAGLGINQVVNTQTAIKVITVHVSIL